jgi:MEMO1 family protein
MFNKEKSVRLPSAAGLFYPASARELKEAVSSYLAGAPAHAEDEGEEVRALIAPHAGYIYSGATAAHAYSRIRNERYDAIVIVGPSHRKYFKGVSLFPGKAYRTPLGDVPVDTALRDSMIDESKNIFLSEDGHRSEHSIEVHLPFLQVLFGEVRFVPVVMGDQTRTFVHILSEKLNEAVHSKKLLLIASSDLSHYHPYDDAVAIDRQVSDLIDRFDSDGLLMNLEDRRAEACGGGCIAAVMRAAKLSGCRTSAILHYCNSGDVSGDKHSVVGYLAASLS